MSSQSRTILKITMVLMLTLMVSLFGLAVVEAAPGLGLSVERSPLLTGSSVVISGQAKTDNDQPIPGLDIAIQISDQDGNHVYVDQVVTDDNGQFLTWAIPYGARTGIYTIKAAAQGLNATATFEYVDTLPPDTVQQPSEQNQLPGPSTPSQTPTPLPGPGTKIDSENLIKLGTDWAKKLISGIVATVDIQPGQQALLEPAIATQLAGTGKSLAVASSDARLILPATTLSGLTGGSLQIGINNPDNSQELETKSAAAAQQLSSMGSDVEIEAWTETVSGNQTWKGRSQLSLALDSQVMSNPARLGRVGIYRWQPQEKVWQYVGGKVDPQTGQIGVWLNGFSRYAVLESTKTFTDISSHWARQDIEVMAARQAARGVTADLFEPERTINRAEFSALLVRSLGLEANSQERLPFNDVAASSWFYGEVAAAYQAGLASGTGSSVFEPEAPITREQLAVMLIRAARVAGISVDQVNEDQALNDFKDRQAISGWAQSEVAVAASLGLVKGTPDGEFLPANKATRAEAITMLRRWSDLRK